MARLMIQEFMVLSAMACMSFSSYSWKRLIPGNKNIKIESQ